MVGGVGMMIIFIDWDIICNLLLVGCWMVLLLLVVFIGGVLVILLLLLLCLIGGWQVKWLICGYVELFQGMLLLMQLFLVFFGVVLFGIDVLVWIVVLVVLMFYISVFLLDIWFGSICVLLKGQWEVLCCFGLSFGQILYWVVVLQVLCIVIVLMVGFVVQVIKGMVLVLIIGFVELIKVGIMLINVIYQLFKVFVLVVLGYFILCYLLFCYSCYLENKFNVFYYY